MSFETDSIDELYNELTNIDIALDTLSKEMPEQSDKAIRAAAEYEEAKNKVLFDLYTEERNDPTLKRTEAMRTCIYRRRHAELRLARELGKQNIQTNRDYLEILKTRQMNIQSRLNLLKAG